MLDSLFISETFIPIEFEFHDKDSSELGDGGGGGGGGGENLCKWFWPHDQGGDDEKSSSPEPKGLCLWI